MIWRNGVQGLRRTLLIVIMMVSGFWILSYAASSFHQQRHVLAWLILVNVSIPLVLGIFTFLVVDKKSSHFLWLLFLSALYLSGPFVLFLCEIRNLQTLSLEKCFYWAVWAPFISFSLLVYLGTLPASFLTALVISPCTWRLSNVFR